MEWVTQGVAASRLNCSVRTIRRRAAAGELQMRNEGRRVLVAIEDIPPGPVADLGRQMANVAASSAIVRAKEADTLQATLTALADERTLHSREIDHCRHVHGHELKRVRRWGVAGWAITILLLTGAGVGWNVLDDRHVAAIDRSNHIHGQETMILRGQMDRAEGMATARGEQIETLESARDQLTNTLTETATKADTLGAERDAATDRLAHAERQLEAIQATTRVGDMVGRAIRRLTEWQGTTAVANGPVSVSSAAARD